MEAFLYPHSPQQGCFFTRINSNGGILLPNVDVSLSLFTPMRVFHHPLSPRLRSFNILLRPQMEVFSSPHSPQWGCILIQLNGGLSTSLFTPIERFFYPCSPQWRCFMFLFTTVRLCFFMLIHPNGGVTSASLTAMEVFSCPHLPWPMLFVYKEVATFTL